MGWYVYGTDFRFEKRVDEHGLCISGDGQQIYSSSLDIHLDVSETEKLPVRWSVYRASEAAGVARLVGTDFNHPRMKEYVDETEVKNTKTPFGIVSHNQRIDIANPRRVGFCVFLPDNYFTSFLDLFNLAPDTSSMRYWFNFVHIGFIPHQMPGQPEDFISYDEWLAGRPCLSENVKFGIGPRVLQEDTPLDATSHGEKQTDEAAQKNRTPRRHWWRGA
jgi:hypothetical protein